MLGRTLPASKTVVPAEETLILDAGHGGEDGGAVSVTGARESDINLEVVLRLLDLLAFYGTDPVLLRYGFSLAAVACLLLGLYYAASFFHRRPHPGRPAFFSLLGIALGLLSLADAPAPYHAALTGACMLSCLAYSCALLRNTFGPPWPERMPSGAQEEREQDGPYEEERRFSDDG